ncbi:hypothetical protein TNCV_1709691 [Trichonephila clavipes]|nr:hypothetical protein TNCV_1709691 [Trichonephila clavipes]
MTIGLPLPEEIGNNVRNPAHRFQTSSAGKRVPPTFPFPTQTTINKSITVVILGKEGVNKNAPFSLPESIACLCHLSSWKPSNKSGVRWTPPLSFPSSVERVRTLSTLSLMIIGEYVRYPTGRT